MNLGTLAGLLIAGGVLSVAVLESSVDPWLLWNPVGLLVVLGGTFAAAFVSFQFGEVMRVFRNFLTVLRNERLYPKRDIEELITVTQLWSRGNFRDLSREIETITNPFLRLGVELATDVMTPIDDIVQVLRLRIDKLRAKEAAEAAVFRAMASYAPAFGMMGTLLGLINMLRGAGAGDFGLLAANMAVALMTTLYGILLAANMAVALMTTLYGIL
ncbi:MAG: MotA/TolQ/ExbB proton channel family protein, partial [Acetobacterales bacterium]